MKRSLSLLALCAMLLSFSACGGEETASGDQLSRIREKGEMVVAMEGTWAPWTYHDEDGELVGFDTEVAEKIAEKLGVAAVFEEGEFDGLLAGVEAGRYDMIVNGVDITEERQEKLSFSEPYAYDFAAVIVASDNDEITCMEDLDGKHTANTINSTYAELAESYGATVTGVDDLAQTFELLLNGRIDATINAEMTYYDYMKAHPDEQIKIACLSDTPNRIAIPMPKGEDSATLVEAVNAALEELRASGELSELSIKYFGVDITEE